MNPVNIQRALLHKIETFVLDSRAPKGNRPPSQRSSLETLPFEIKTSAKLSPVVDCTHQTYAEVGLHWQNRATREKLVLQNSFFRKGSQTTSLKHLYTAEALYQALATPSELTHLHEVVLPQSLAINDDLLLYHQWLRAIVWGDSEQCATFEKIHAKRAKQANAYNVSNMAEYAIQSKTRRTGVSAGEAYISEWLSGLLAAKPLVDNNPWSTLDDVSDIRTQWDALSGCLLGNMDLLKEIQTATFQPETEDIARHQTVWSCVRAIDERRNKTQADMVFCLLDASQLFTYTLGLPKNSRQHGLVSLAWSQALLQTYGNGRPICFITKALKTTDDVSSMSLLQRYSQAALNTIKSQISKNAIINWHDLQKTMADTPSNNQLIPEAWPYWSYVNNNLSTQYAGSLPNKTVKAKPTLIKNFKYRPDNHTTGILFLTERKKLGRDQIQQDGAMISEFLIKEHDLPGADAIVSDNIFAIMARYYQMAEINFIPRHFNSLFTLTKSATNTTDQHILKNYLVALHQIDEKQALDVKHLTPDSAQGKLQIQIVDTIRQAAVENADEKTINIVDQFINSLLKTKNLAKPQITFASKRSHRI